jgi:hypothetical protein
LFDLLGRRTRLCEGISRRGFLRVGSLGLAGLSLPALLRARAAQPAALRRDTAVILYWMAGGPSQLDTYDLKPGAPAEVRGPFKPVRTKAPGLDLCELLPSHAQVADRFSLVRSLRHRNADHFDASHWVQTGYHEPKVMGRGQPHPAQGAVVARLRGANSAEAPPYVCIPEAYNPTRSFYQMASYLGARYNPVNAGGDASLRRYQGAELSLPENLPVPRVEGRRALLGRVDGMVRTVEASDAFHAMDENYRRAFELVTSPRVKKALDLNREPAILREKYGHHYWGRFALLARRLVEAGVTFVTINHFEADVDWWDDHYVIEKNLRKRLPLFDQALGTLIADLHERGLGDRVLVAAVGEFGRSPVIDKLAGRGHWPRAFTALLSGGGIKGGQVVGATTANAGEPKDRPLGPGDLLATIYHALGLDPTATLPDRQNRPIRLVDEGQPIAELF